MTPKFFHASYRIFHAGRRWRTHHINPPGLVVLSALLLSMVFGIHISQTSIYRLAALLIAMVVIALVSGAPPFRPRLTITRILPEKAMTDTELAYELEITNHHGKTLSGLVCHEIITDPRPTLNTLLASPEPYEQFRNRWDRKTLYYRWTWLIRKNSKALFSPIPLPDIDPGETIRLPVTCTPLHRGYLHLEAVAVTRPDVLGLFNRRIILPLPDKLLILPGPVPTAVPRLSTGRSHQPGGISLASSIGNSDEFMSLRSYRPGDPLRNIHWRSFAKTNELIIKEFEDEFYVRHALVLDTSLSRGNELHFEEAVARASSLVLTMQQAKDAVLDLMFMGDRAYNFSSGRGLAPVEKMLEILACVEPDRNGSIEALIPVLENKITRLSGVICLFLDWTDAHREMHAILNRFSVPSCVLVVTAGREEMEEKIRTTGTALHTVTILEANPLVEEAR